MYLRDITLVIIIQARIGSSRFPGKSMHFFNGKPSIDYLIESLLQAFNKCQLYIATSEKSENDIIRNYCIKNNIAFYSGDETNVASRFYEILKTTNCDYFVRLNADSPLFDYRLLRKELDNINKNIDVISTVYSKRFPAGMNFEIIKKQSFMNEYKNFRTSDHFEHVTKYFYENQNKFRIMQVENIIQDPEYYRFTFDTEEDKNIIQKLLDQMIKPHYTYTLKEKCEIFNNLFKC